MFKTKVRLKIQLDPKLKASLKDTSRKLTGIKKRAFIAQVTIDYCHSSPRQAETYMGWSRKAVTKGINQTIRRRIKIEQRILVSIDRITIMGCDNNTK